MIMDGKTLNSLRKQYPEGTRVRLEKMHDDFAPPVGTEGTVFGVDSIGSLLVAWDNGSNLNVLYGYDRVVKI